MSFTKLYLIITLGLLGLHAQENPHYSQFDMNLLGQNAAFAGWHSEVDLRLGIRPQWIGFDDAPLSLFGNISSRFKKNPTKKKYSENFNAWGLEIASDRQGRMSTNGMVINYAFNMAVSGNLRLSIGTKVGMSFHRFSASDLKTADINDPLLLESTTSFTFPEISFGSVLYGETSYYSIALNQLVPLKNGRGTTASQRFDLHLSTGHIFNMGPRWQLRPSLQVRWEAKSPFNIQVLSIFMFDQWLGAGVSYRNIDAVGIHLRAFIKDIVRIGYAYEMPTSSMRFGTLQTHELTIGIIASKTQKKTGLYYSTQF